MKKFSLTVLAVVAAGLAQAASVTWSSGDLSDIVLDHSDITSVTAYYYVLDETADSRIIAMASDELVATYVDRQTGAVKDGVDGLNREVRDSETASRNSLVGGDSIDWTQSDAAEPNAYVLAIYVAESRFGGHYAVAGIGRHEVDNNNVIEGISARTNNDLIGVDAYDSAGGWAAVPEPTTIAFLALGLAAIGLKRKVA